MKRPRCYFCIHDHCVRSCYIICEGINQAYASQFSFHAVSVSPFALFHCLYSRRFFKASRGSHHPKQKGNTITANDSPRYPSGIMGRNVEENIDVNSKFDQDLEEKEYDKDSIFSLLPPKSPLSNSRPSSMVVKKVCHREFIPPHIVAEAISTLHGLDLRWSGPITPSEMLYVEQYVHSKYPQYSHGLVEESDKNDLYSWYYIDAGDANSNNTSPSRRSPSSAIAKQLDIDMARLEPSRLLDMLAKKTSFLGSFVSIPEIQARTRVLRHSGLSEEDYLVLFAPSRRDAIMLVGEGYPFFRYNYYMTILEEEGDYVREFASYKDAKVISAPETWLDLRIKGSQLSQYFRRKCKHSPKGLFAYPADVRGTRYSMHWVSEAHRNSWHVLLDATPFVVGKDRLSLALHRPDFVLCTLDGTHAANPSKEITCLLVRRRAFDATRVN
ncbi:uncharacterized protein LOC122049059 [Zingiber officinale]|uniref:uncharacterized protein LOC122049059 n=1 Tax=Zingiber officinale TaxID=94328 RepID=UPI001C4D5C78|nr:uncharacterized protein LOC122049059 [Zingiber officinale]